MHTKVAGGIQQWENNGRWDSIWLAGRRDVVVNNVFPNYCFCSFDNTKRVVVVWLLITMLLILILSALLAFFSDNVPI